MKLEKLFRDDEIKGKEKVAIVCQWIIDSDITADELLSFAETAKDTVKGSCIEALEYATKINPDVANEKVFEFAIKNLADSKPRIKWESAKVVGNIAHRFPGKLPETIKCLQSNTRHEGTVVRWATAYALGEILKLNTKWNIELLPAIEDLCKNEMNAGVRKKYTEAIKKLNKS